MVLTALLTAMMAGRIEDAASHLTVGAYGRGVQKLADEVRGRSQRLHLDARPLVVSDRAIAPLVQHNPKGRAGRCWLCLVLHDGRWRLTGVEADGYVAQAYLVRWLDAGQAVRDLPYSVEGAAWWTDLVLRLQNGEPPRTLLSSIRVQAEPAVRSAAVARLADAWTEAGERPRVAMVGAHLLRPTQRCSVGLVVIGGATDVPVWLTFENTFRGSPTLLSSAGTPAMRHLVVGAQLNATIAQHVALWRDAHIKLQSDTDGVVVDPARVEARAAAVELWQARVTERLRTALAQRQTAGLEELRRGLHAYLEQQSDGGSAPFLKTHGAALVAAALSGLVTPPSDLRAASDAPDD